MVQTQGLLLYDLGDIFLSEVLFPQLTILIWALVMIVNMYHVCLIMVFGLSFEPFLFDLSSELIEFKVESFVLGF
jgi:hypothetical protein